MYRVAVLASGSGTNLQALIDRLKPAESAELVLVLSNRPGAQALERARQAGIEQAVIQDPGDQGEITSRLETAGADLVVLAGYLKLVPAAVVSRFRNRMINIHPALLPAFGGPGMYGIKVHQAVIDSGAAVSGATVHLVSEEFDRGKIVAQWPVPVLAGDTAESLASRVLEVEHRLLPEVVLAAARTGRVVPLKPELPWFDSQAPRIVPVTNPGVSD